MSNLAKVKQIAHRIIQNEHDVRQNPKHQSGQHVVALVAPTYSVCVAVQPLCVLALMCRGFFDIWKPSVIPQTKVLVEFLALVVCGLCGVLFSRLRLNMFLELWSFRFVSTQSRQFPCNTPRLIHARAVLEPCHGDPWLLAPLRRRGAHVVPSCGSHTLLVPNWTSAVLNLMSLRRIWYMSNPVLTIGALSRLLLVRIVSACSRHHILFTLKVFLPCTYVVLDRVLSVLRHPVSFSQWASGNQAVGVVASANHMFINSNRLIVVDQMVFNCQC